MYKYIYVTIYYTYHNVYDYHIISYIYCIYNIHNIICIQLVLRLSSKKISNHKSHLGRVDNLSREMATLHLSLRFQLAPLLHESRSITCLVVRLSTLTNAENFNKKRRWVCFFFKFYQPLPDLQSFNSTNYDFNCRIIAETTSKIRDWVSGDAVPEVRRRLFYRSRCCLENPHIQECPIMGLPSGKLT